MDRQTGAIFADEMRVAVDDCFPPGDLLDRLHEAINLYDMRYGTLEDGELTQSKVRIRELEEQHSDFLDAIESYLNKIEDRLDQAEALIIFRNARDKSNQSDKEDAE